MPRQPRCPRDPWALPTVRVIHFPLSLSPRWKSATVPYVKGEKHVLVPRALLEGSRVEVQSTVIRCKTRNTSGTIINDIAFQAFFRRDSQYLVNPSLHNLTGVEWRGDLFIAKVGVLYRNDHVSLTSDLTPLALEAVTRFMQYVDTENSIPETLVLERTHRAPYIAVPAIVAAPAPAPAPAPGPAPGHAPAPTPAPGPAPGHAPAPAPAGVVYAHPRTCAGVRDLTRRGDRVIATPLTAQSGAMVLRSRRVAQQSAK